MKPSSFVQNYRQITPPKDGMLGQGNNKTKLAKSTGKIGVNCDHCGISYETYACWIKRHNHHFCSFACASKHKEIQITSACEICGTLFTTTPSNWSRIVTCSRKCLAKKRSIFMATQVQDMSNSPVFNFGNHEDGLELGIAKLTAEQVTSIYLDPRSQAAIALDYGVSQENISSIKTNKTWRHVTAKLTPRNPCETK